MRCNEILCVEKLERRAVARDLVRGRNQITRGIGKSGSVQHLANVASCFGSLSVVVQKRDAGNDVEQRNAAENRESLAREGRREEPGW